MNNTKPWRRWFVGSAGFAGVLAAAVVAGNVWVVETTKNRVFDHIGEVPEREVGLLLGTGKTTRSGNPNPHFVHRVQAAAELYHAGKIKHLLVSGDNHVAGYDEPTDMKDALVAAGVPASAVTLDYAGFRTLDSVVRAREVFGVKRLTVISERFHNYRALFIAQRCGMDAVAFCAEEVGLRYSVKVTLREYLARLKAVADLYVLRTRPRFLGEPVPVGWRRSPRAGHIFG
jgi:SanA protein